MVAIEIFKHRVIPGQRSFAREVTFDHRTAAALNGLALGVADFPLRDIAERDHRPDILAAGFQRLNLFQAGANLCAEAIEYRLHIADLRAQMLFHLANRRFVVGG